MDSVPEKRKLQMPDIKQKRRKLTDKALKSRQKEFIKLLKSLDKSQLADACDIVERLYPKGVALKPNGKKTIRTVKITKVSKLEEIMNHIEVMRSTNLSEIPMALRRHREYQLRATVDGQNCYRVFIMSGANSLHDLSRACMVVFHWMPNQKQSIFKWKTNGGQPFGNFELRKEIMEKLKNRTALQKVSIAETFKALDDKITWFYGDRRIIISCDGVTPGKDKIARGLPRCCGGEGVGPPHMEALKNTWHGSWEQDDVLTINECFLGDRFRKDGFKTYSEYDLDKGSALRRTAPFFDQNRNLLTPFTERRFFFPPIDPDMSEKFAWRFLFRVVRKAEVREGLDMASQFLCGLDQDTKVYVDKVDLITRRARICHPVTGWVYLRGVKGKRVLQEVKHVRDNEESYKF